MQTQFLLPGFKAAPPTDRLFFAALPDDETAARILRAGARLRRACGIRARLHDARKLHVSLQHLGIHVQLPRALVDAALRGAARVRAPAFDVELGRALTFAGRTSMPVRKPFVLLPTRGAEALCQLSAALGAALCRESVDARTARFTPHVTLLYDTVVVAPRAVAPVCWRVHELALVHHVIGAGRPYSILGRFPLAAPDAASGTGAAAAGRGCCAAPAGVEM